MSNKFISLVYATLKERKPDENTDEWEVEKAVEEYNNLIGKTGRYNVETGELEDKRKEKMLEKKFDTLEKQVDGVLSGEYKDQHITMREDTPKILQAIGIPNKPMLMTVKHAYLAINSKGKYNKPNDHYHDLGKELFMNIPAFLESPIMVFQSNKDKDDVVAIINAVDKQKNPVIVPIRINGRGRQNFVEIDANILKSTYGKKNVNDYIKNNVRTEDMLLIQNKIIRKLENLK